MPWKDKEKRRQYDRKWYRENREKKRAWDAAYKARVGQWLEEYKAGLACKQCGEDHPAAIQFHHRDPSQKEINIGDANRRSWSIDRMREELEKCDVLCANCHAKLHWEERNGVKS